jgi:predicted transcriptional regulator
VTADKIAAIHSLLERGMPRRRVAASLGVSEGAVQHYARQRTGRNAPAGHRAPQLVSDAEMTRIYAGRRYEDVRFRR